MQIPESRALSADRNRDPIFARFDPSCDQALWPLGQSKKIMRSAPSALEVPRTRLQDCTQFTGKQLRWNALQESMQSAVTLLIFDSRVAICYRSQGDSVGEQRARGIATFDARSFFREATFRGDRGSKAVTPLTLAGRR